MLTHLSLVDRLLRLSNSTYSLVNAFCGFGYLGLCVLGALKPGTTSDSSSLLILVSVTGTSSDCLDLICKGLGVVCNAQGCLSALGRLLEAEEAISRRDDTLSRS